MNTAHENRKTHEQRRSRRGTATFELLMTAPLLFAMIILITWLGFSVVGQSEVIVEARHDAWQKRFDEPPGEPLVFLRGDVLENSFLDPKDTIEGEAEKSFKISPLVDNLATPEAKMSLVVGSWDYRQLPLDEPPNWKVHGLMLASAALGKFQNLFVQAGNLWNNVENAASEIASWQNEQFDFLDNNVKNLEGGLDAEKEKRRQELEQDLDRTNRRIEALNQELDETNQKIQDLFLSRDDAKEKGDKQREESLQNELEILLAKRNRLKTDLQDAEKDRQALREKIAEL